MSADANKKLYQKYKNDPLLRREAGEGWHSDSPDSRVLRAIITREMLVDAFDAHDDASQEAYFEQAVRVGNLKKEAGIGDSPATLPPSTPSTGT